MTTSGNTIYQLSRNEIIEAAIGLLGAIAAGQTPTTEDYTISSKFLNTTIARFRTKGLSLWARKSYTWTPTTDTYLIGDGKTLDTPYPIHILQAWRTDSGGAKIPLDIDADYDFNQYPATVGDIPFKLTYTPAINYGTIKLWPTGLTTNTNTLTIVYTRPLEYFDASTDTMDLPEEWYDAIIWDLATKIAPRWGVPIPDRRELKAEAKAYLDAAMESGFEDASFYLSPSSRP